MAAMLSPARCICGAVYDLAAVEVIGRHADCSVWKAPCCGRTVDDNIWKDRHDFTRITADEAERPYRTLDGYLLMPDGRILR